MNIVLLISGMFLDAICLSGFPADFIPLMEHFVNSIWFGVLMTVDHDWTDHAAGRAVNLYVGANVANITLKKFQPQSFHLSWRRLLPLKHPDPFSENRLFMPRLLGYIQ